jgi:hypothetical protein
MTLYEDSKRRQSILESDRGSHTTQRLDKVSHDKDGDLTSCTASAIHHRYYPKYNTKARPTA